MENGWVDGIRFRPAGRIDATPVSDRDVAALLRSVTDASSSGLFDDPLEFRISIAGAREKTALLELNGQWHVPKNATPTTHILY